MFTDARVEGMESAIHATARGDTDIPSPALAARAQGGHAARRFDASCWAETAALFVLGLALALPSWATEATDVHTVADSLNESQELGTPNRPLSNTFAFILLFMVPTFLVVWIHNSHVKKEESVLEPWAQTESNFQRRTDLIPALVDTVSRYLQHQRETLGEITEARASTLHRLTQSTDSPWGQAFTLCYWLWAMGCLEGFPEWWPSAFNSTPNCELRQGVHASLAYPDPRFLA